jgi:CBS domain-containing protein
MVREKVRSLPVLEGDRVVGMISRRDVLRLLVLDSETIRVEVARRVRDVTGETVAVVVEDGVVTLAAGSSDRATELGSLVARTVPGVLRVRR